MDAAGAGAAAPVLAPPRILSDPRGSLHLMAAAGVRWFGRLPEPDRELRRLMYRARRRRAALDLSRKVTAYFEVRWAFAARDLRDALDDRREPR